MAIWHPLHRRVPAGVLMAALCIASGPAAVAAQDPGMSWDSIRALPDFSGPWTVLPPPKMPDPVTREAHQKSVGAAAAAEREGVDPASIGYQTIFCQPPRFAGYNKSDQSDYFEILFTPGRVTITNELGLIRRIRLGGARPPEILEETAAGTSTGHWDGQTLVVETSGLKRDTFMLRNPALRIGPDASVVERLGLPEPDVLEVHTRIVAPSLLLVPYESTVRYRRYPAHEMHEMVVCAPEDRSYDHAAGRERFDLTPPSDLPPPPSGSGRP